VGYIARPYLQNKTRIYRFTKCVAPNIIRNWGVTFQKMTPVAHDGDLGVIFTIHIFQSVKAY
jgi:hypothetical protein